MIENIWFIASFWMGLALLASLLSIRLGISVALALVASYFPARRAARLDPCATFQEI